MTLESKLKIGIFGGTFNPVHNGHLKIAEAALKKFKLDKVVFVPSYHPPHKRRVVRTSFAHRYKMVKLAVEKNPRLGVSSIEKKLGGISYTVRTLRRFKKIYPGASLYLIIGADSLAEFSTWREPKNILKLAEIITFPRKDFSPSDADKLRPILGIEGVRKIKKGFLKMTGVNISSTEIRTLLAKSKPAEKFLPPPVAKYLKNHPRIYC